MKSVIMWLVVENICILASIIVLCYILDSGWPCLFVLCLNIHSSSSILEKMK